MDTIKRMRTRLARSERGAGLVEYLFLTALIAIVCLVAVTFFGQADSANLQKSADAVGGVTSTTQMVCPPGSVYVPQYDHCAM